MNVLFVCVGNTGRSLMAERLFRRASTGGHEGRSAGVMPGSRPEPVVLEALAELGIDASDHVPRKLDDEALAWADVAVAMFPELEWPLTWPVTDPYGRTLDEVRAIRDDIAARVDRLVAELA